MWKTFSWNCENKYSRNTTPAFFSWNKAVCKHTTSNVVLCGFVVTEQEAKTETFDISGEEQAMTNHSWTVGFFMWLYMKCHFSWWSTTTEIWLAMVAILQANQAEVEIDKCLYPCMPIKKTNKFIHISYDSILICKKSRLHSGTCGWFLGEKKKKIRKSTSAMLTCNSTLLKETWLFANMYCFSSCLISMQITCDP